MKAKGVEMISTPALTSPAAKSAIPVLSATEIRARRTGRDSPAGSGRLS